MMISLKEILNSIDYIDYQGAKELIINEVVSLDFINGKDNAISWCNDKNLNKLEKVNSSSLIIVSKFVNSEVVDRLNCIIVDNPRRTFQEVLLKFFTKKREAKINKTAFIDKDCILGNNVFIGYNVVIENKCTIGENVVILHNTVILEGTIIGDNVVIGSNNTIGGIGFGYEKTDIGDFKLIPHIGNVVIGDNVDIGNNTCIDRAVLGSTILEENVKVDNLVHIAHGVKVGRNSVVIANAMVAGSVNIGENSWIAPSSSIINKKSVGDNALVGLGAVVTKNVESNTIVAGNPAKFIRKV